MTFANVSIGETGQSQALWEGQEQHEKKLIDICLWSISAKCTANALGEREGKINLFSSTETYIRITRRLGERGKQNTRSLQKARTELTELRRKCLEWGFDERHIGYISPIRGENGFRLLYNRWSGFQWNVLGRNILYIYIWKIFLPKTSNIYKEST